MWYIEILHIRDLVNYTSRFSDRCLDIYFTTDGQSRGLGVPVVFAVFVNRSNEIAVDRASKLPAKYHIQQVLVY